MKKIILIFLLLTLIACEKDRYFIGVNREVRIIKYEFQADTSLYYDPILNWNYVGVIEVFYYIDRSGLEEHKNIREDLQNKWRRERAIKRRKSSPLNNIKQIQ